MPDGTAAPEAADPVIDYAPTARPGHRAPHLALEHRGSEISTLDLFDRSFTLLAGESGRDWCDASRAVARSLGVPLDAHTVGAGGDLRDRDDRWRELYGVSRTGAVLVRPDGHVGWRSVGGASDREAELSAVLRRILAR